MEMDGDYLTAMEFGIERLLMVLTNSDTIKVQVLIEWGLYFN